MAVCRSCGADLPAAARFCPRCGVRVATLAADERKVVTVLFADIAASTATGAERDPEDARALIRPQLALMRDELSRHGGTIEKYIGDAVMAVFGAPVAHEDDPERAVRAALAIRDALGAGVRVAVNTGEAVVALAAEPEAGEGFVSGDVVNTAFRIEEATPDGAVCVGEATYRATVDAIEYGERRLVTAKGKEEPLAVWEASGAPSEPRADYGPPLAPLVGRKEELSLILATLARARRDKTVQLVTLVGVPGIGKSRLVWELQRALEDEPGLVTWRRGRCLPYGDGVAYWALGEMVKTQAGVLETDDAPTADTKLAQAVRDLLADPAEAAWVEGHLRPLLALDAATAERREESFAAWRRFFAALADWGPLVLAFEDLHWADEGLLDFIEHAADWSRDAPLLLLCTARPELLDRRRDWGARGNALTIALPPLSEDETARLVSLLLHQTVPDELRKTLLAHAEGNPLYAEELVRMLVDRRLLVRDGDAWTLRATELPMPESVQGIIASRLDALSSDEKALVQAAAVVGRTFWPGAVAVVAGAARDEVDGTLPAFDRRELVRRHRTSTIGGEPQYAFRHVLVRDVAYSQIPRARRAEKHLLAAGWIESLGRPEDHAETLAHHYLEALEYTRALDRDVEAFAERARHALRRAGDRALRLSAFPAARGYFEAALELWPDGDPTRSGLVYGIAKAGFSANQASEEELAGARDSLLAAGVVERAAEVESMIGAVAVVRGERDAAFAHRRAAVELLASRPPSPSKAYVLVNLAIQLSVSDEIDEAVRVGREALEIAELVGLDDLRARALRALGTARARSGDAQGVADLEASIELALADNSPECILSYFNLAAVHWEAGDLRRAFELHEQARNATARFGDLRAARWLEGELVLEHYFRGDWDKAEALADVLLEAADAGEHFYSEPLWRIVRGHIYIARDEDARAREESDRAVETSRVARDSQLRLPALAFAARVYAADETLRGLLEAIDAAPNVFVGPWLADFAVAASALGMVDEAERALKAVRPSRWTAAAFALLADKPERAADLYREIGSAPDEAYARVRAAELATAAGEPSDLA